LAAAAGIHYEDEDIDVEDEDEGESQSEVLTEAQVEDFVGLLGEELDVEVVVDEEDELFEEANAIVDEELRSLQIAEEGWHADTVVNKEFIQNELRRLIPNADGAKETTLQSFHRLTSDHAWIPFRMPDSPVPATDIDDAEADYFTEQEQSYSVSAKSSSKRSYRNFSIAWNLEVSRRFKLWTREGEDLDVQQLRLKSPQQLEDYYNKRQQLQSLQITAEDNEDENNHQQLLNTQLRTTRQQLPPRQEPHIVSPPQFMPQFGSITPFANPTNLNAFVTMNAVMGMSVINNLRPVTAPFQVQLPNLPAAPPPRPTRKLFRSKMFCSACGWRKKDHTLDEGKGKKPCDCSRNFCGNCFQLKEVHEAEGIPFGYTCTNKTNDFCKVNVNDWWEYKVCYVASLFEYCCYCDALQILQTDTIKLNTQS
jgi:hypothetical protein